MSWTPPRKFDASLSPSDFSLDVARGNVADVSSVNKFGYNLDIDVAAEPVWSGGGTYPGWVTTAAPVSIASSSAADAAAGTGMRTLRIFGLSDTFQAISEDVTLNGTSAVTTAASFIRVYRKFGLTAGSGQTNAGLITASIGGSVAARIEIGDGQTEMAIWAVPSGSTFHLTDLVLTAEGNGEVDFILNVRTGIDTATPVTLVKNTFRGLSGNNVISSASYGSLTGPADVWVSAENGNNNSISAAFVGFLAES